MRNAWAFAAILAGCGDDAPPDVCRDYLGCLGERAPEGLAEAEAIYGEGGSCWSISTYAREGCELTCATELEVCEALAWSDTDPGVPVDSGDPDPGDTSIDMSWDASGIDVALAGFDTSGFDFGMAETADPDDGWYGEDCLNGTASYRYCHVFQGSRGALTYVPEVSDVVPGETTLFSNAFADRLTYVITVDGGACFVWGHDPAYYLDSPRFASCTRF